ncbi:hypothetical protein SHVI106290_10625 [Shewanella violacea]|uniref:Uncharacterized protein n=1 Tax=Shewanella violacea (strain JCM 10179 / CIP 106290 / LMG 19151 / DSS12) TaxID=637905 RepID=D4ZJU2_SHEVD|nr:hypothetical protein SVI_1970 [Shewanella violacea DSS12]
MHILIAYFKNIKNVKIKIKVKPKEGKDEQVNNQVRIDFS